MHPVRVGGLFAYLTLPKALDFLLSFPGEGVVPLITFDRYMGFVVLVTLAFGASLFRSRLGRSGGRRGLVVEQAALVAAGLPGDRGVRGGDHALG